MNNRKMASVGKAIADDKFSISAKFSMDEALYLQAYLNLSKVSYTTLRLTLLPHGLILPTYDLTALHRKENVIPKIRVGYKLVTEQSIYPFNKLYCEV